MIRSILAAALLSAAALANPAAAALPTLDSWLTLVEAAVGAGVVVSGSETGTTLVAFTRSADGSAAGVTIVRQSGSAVLDRKALRAIQALRRLPALPDGVDPARPIEMAVTFHHGDLARDLAVASQAAARRG